MARESKSSKNPFDKRWLTYSIAAGAALSVAGTSDAGVIYSGTKNIKVNSSNPSVNIDINGDSIMDFHFQYTSQLATFSYYQHFSIGIWVNGYNTYNQVIGEDIEPISNILFAPYRLASGNYVSAGMAGNWSSWPGILNGIKYNALTINQPLSKEEGKRTLGNGATVQMGNFVGNRGFLGVRFKIGNNIHYGWIEYEGSELTTLAATEGVRRLKNGLPFIEGTILGWAYEDVPDKRIKVGDKGGPPQPVPTLNEWGMIFLMGLILAEGARRLRKRSAEA